MSDKQDKKYGKLQGDTDKKKAIVLKNNKTKTKPILILFLVFGVLTAGAATYFSLTPMKNQTPFSLSNNEGVAPHTDQTTVTYNAKDFNDGIAKHYHYDNNGQKIRYFILKSSDGVIRAAFDACDVCWPSGKGYYQDKDEMVCRNCNRRFSSIRINEVQGGCNPAPLNREVKEDTLIIKIKDILEGKRYFDFS